MESQLLLVAFIFAVMLLTQISRSSSSVTAGEHANDTSKILAAAEPCPMANPIDRCWRCDPDWEKNRKRLAECSMGFANPTSGGKLGNIYLVTNPGDDASNPTQGTLRHGVIQKGPSWIIFQRDMTITLKKELRVSSNTTIDGRGAVVHIADGPCIMIREASNIIIHGLHIHHCKPEVSQKNKDQFGDGITVYAGNHIWIDHCTLYSCNDGLIDVIHGSTSVTISNTHMRDHDKVMLLGNNETLANDKAMKVTVAFNRFGRGLVQRMPRCRFGNFHVVNNDYEGWENYAIGGSAAPTINSQGNRFRALGQSKREVTKRETEEGESVWRKWNWRSEGDVFENGAYFNGSGSKAPADYASATSLDAQPASLVESMTKEAGALTCKKGQRC